jgi:acetolactate decarboxylase
LRTEETYKVRAPFFVYANIEKWMEVALPDSIQTIPQLESFLDQTTKNRSRPFTFRLAANIDHCNIHIVNLPTGTEVHMPDDAHQNQKTYTLKDESVQMVGFYSTEHQGVFTHHDTDVHIHLITDDKTQMGHLEELVIKKGTAKLFLPGQ